MRITKLVGIKTGKIINVTVHGIPTSTDVTVANPEINCQFPFTAREGWKGTFICGRVVINAIGYEIPETFRAVE